MAEIARRQYGVVSIGQLRGLGYSTRAVSRHVASGSLHRLHRGVFAVGHLDIPPRGRCLAAVLAAGEGAVSSHYSAAWLWGLSKTSPLPPHVTAPQPRRSAQGFALHRARNLLEVDRAEVDGIPVTAVPRTLLDQAAKVRFGRLQRMLQRAEELRLFDLGPVEDLLARTAGHHGSGTLRRAVALYRPPRFTRSQLERDFLAALQRAGLPDPVTAYNEIGYELDFYWPDRRFAVELDTFETHGTRASFESDRLREEDLKLAGIEIDRITGFRFEREPDRVLERVRALLARRPRDGGRRSA